MGGVLIVILLLGLCLVVMAGLPAAGLWWLARWLKRRNYQRMALATQILLAGFIAFCLSIIYSFYFPFDSEFENEFVTITSLPFPTSGQVIQGEASGLDLHGDYTACARIHVSKEDYERVLKSIMVNSTFQHAELATDSSFVSTEQFSSITEGTKRLAYVEQFSRGQINEGAYEFIGFLPDRHTIVIYRCIS